MSTRRTFSDEVLAAALCAFYDVPQMKWSEEVLSDMDNALNTAQQVVAAESLAGGNDDAPPETGDNDGGA